MSRFALIAMMIILFAGSLDSHNDNETSQGVQRSRRAQIPSHTYLGFDRNIYPGDENLGALRKIFSFSGYWLNNPPGENSNSWQRKRAILVSNGFGFLVLFNGRLNRELKSTPSPNVFGARDAHAAVAAAKTEGFPIGTIIFLDQEEGGRLLSEQRAYLHGWIDGVNTSPYRAGVYCSGIPAREGKRVFVTTAEDIRNNSHGRSIFYFVYNDVCPPSPGCAGLKDPPSPAQSGVAFAVVWQFAQSPRRKEVTAACASTYSPDGNCYALPLRTPASIYVDANSAISGDPSRGR